MLRPCKKYMNKQELLKQADTNFQRGNRELAKKYLAELLKAYPKEEAAWILLAKVVDEKERKIECYEKALKINPNSTEIKLALARLKFPSETLPKSKVINETHWSAPRKPALSGLRVLMIIAVIILGLGSTTYAIARSNPESAVAKLILPATADPFVQTLAEDVAAQTRSEVNASYPQYAHLVDTLIGFALSNAESGMEGAPPRPGAAIIPSDSVGEEARLLMEKSMPKPGTLASVTLSEQQLTSWLAMNMKHSADLPLSDIQVYLRDDKVQVWGMVAGTSNSTSALIVGKLGIDSSSNPFMEIESMQIGQQVIPGILLSQAESWLNQALLDQINQQAPGLRIMNINVSNGLITMSGMR
jgi:tetratricopeptide (TPR) repeat protein